MGFLWLLLVVVLGGPQQPQPSATAPKPYEDPEAYEVYAAALPPKDRWGMRGEYLVIKQETFAEGCGIPLDNCLKGGEAFKKAWGDVLADFKTKNSSVWVLNKPIPGPIAHKIVPGEEIRAAFSQGKPDPWTGFYRGFPRSGGTISLSAVGFAGNKTKALVFVGHSYHLVGAADGYVFLEKQEGKWKVVRSNATTVCLCGA